jgi:hypothetical protein
LIEIKHLSPRFQMTDIQVENKSVRFLANEMKKTKQNRKEKFSFAVVTKSSQTLPR